MSTSDRLYKVFISSTFLDNADRRKLVQDAITTADMVWHGMEIFTASAQTSVEECKRFAGEADLLVGIIAHRYGWEPDGEKSITEMEYDVAKEAGVDCLMFQLDNSNVDIKKDFDPGPERWDKQKKLEAFKNKFAKDQMPGYFTETTLQARVQKALMDWRNKKAAEESETLKDATVQSNSAAKNNVDGGRDVNNDPHVNLESDVSNYRAKAENLHATLPVAGFVTQLKVPIDIEDIYVPLQALIDLRGVNEEHFSDAAHAEKCLRGGDKSLEISLPDAFKQGEKRKRKGLVILGDPGSGKTTHLKRILLYCLRKSPEELGLPSDMIPVFLPLRELKNLKQGLDAFIQDQLDTPHLNTKKGFGKRLLDNGNLLFLLDGLDEVADIGHRELVAEWIINAVAAHPDCRFVVSCRFAGYSKTVQMDGNFLEMHVRPFDEKQAEAFVYNWYGIVEKGLAKDPDQAEETAKEKAGNLIKRLKEPDFRARRVFELTRNPLLLTNICLVHRHRGTLPKKRARLYKECIDVLLQHWKEAINLSMEEITAQKGRRALQPAAFWLHQEDGRTRATASELAPHIEPALKAVNLSNGSAEDFLKKIRDESGLLTGWDQEHYGFMHLSFQEYLAAREIRRLAFTESEILKELAGHFGDSWWQEVTLILLALEDPSLFEPFMKEVVKLPAFAEKSGFVETCLEDAAEISMAPFIGLLKAEPGKKKGLWKRQLTALRILERNDPDEVEKLKALLSKHPFPEIRNRVTEQPFQQTHEQSIAGSDVYELVKIPGGIFMMGSPDNEEGRDDDEGPVHKVDVPDFYMGKYPVTNEEYGHFLKENSGIKEPEYWGDRKFNQSKQPVVGVSWEDAKKYAAWVGLRLPSEAEWEYACRAGKDTRYCNGNSVKDLERAGWYDDNSDGHPHPVGEKEPNGFGLYDVHGNVWEWVEDHWHGTYDSAPVDGKPWCDRDEGDDRVVRGGSWLSGARDCRSAIRFSYRPGFRDNNVGFRLSRSV